MSTPTAAVKFNPLTGALIDPIAATFASANGFLTSGTSDAKASVVCATTSNGTLSTAFENGDTVDGITLTTGDRILIKNQSTASQNGIYTVNASGAPTRATDFDAWTEIVGAFVTVESGTVNAGTQWLCNVVSGGTMGTTAITFVVPKNFVDLTTAQTVTGEKIFSNPANSYGGLYLSDGASGPIPNCELIMNQEGTVLMFAATGANTYIIRDGGGATDITLPLTGTLLSTADLGAGVKDGVLVRPLFATNNSGSGDVTLVAESAQTQEVTGASDMAFTLPVAATLTNGWPVTIKSNAAGPSSNGTITVKTSGGNEVIYLYRGQSATVVCSDAGGGTGLASWSVINITPSELVATLASDQSLTDGVEETLVFQGAVGSLAPALDGGTGIFTAPHAGTVIIETCVQAFCGDSAGYEFWASVYWRKNGGSANSLGFYSGLMTGSSPYNGQTTLSGICPITVSAGDTIAISATLSDAASGGDLYVNSNTWKIRYL